ncbi:predicted protein [Naegleria gruberi]|uniref:Predicted protein n=1 Tax=Naegleria gruberi TaxID=5762 RepID=D2UYX3_NAEGR|nr:uncharacterized protein NAEGRDRAFT_45345 [Naegleria gruberi]EFC49851.1 predicted protein [Naegleria gruberi]|eukprot:XP_002682595.1 predicted protein [Naegleria gruberi strain NEG-M]
MSVFYKFKSAKDYDTITVEGNGISLSKLKQSIATQKKLPKTMDYDLVLENAQTGEVYKYDQDVVPKNTSVLVKRVPVTRSVGSANNNPSANSQPAIIPPSNNNSSSLLSNNNNNTNQKSLTGSLFSRNTSSNDSGASFASVFSGSSGNETTEETIGEEQKLRDLANNTGKWIPDTPSQQQHHSQSKRIPPPNYICHRCKKTGHYIQHCPTNGDARYNIKTIRIPVGIPKSFLQPIEAPKADSNNTVVMPGGNLAVLAPNEKEFSKILGKKNVEIREVPKEFQCSICSKILTDAVTIPCCKTNYCNNCITHALIHDTHLTCPNCKSPDQSIDALAPNYDLRRRVDNYKANLDSGAPPSLLSTATSQFNSSSSYHNSNNNSNNYNNSNSAKSSPPSQNYNSNSGGSNNHRYDSHDNKQDNRSGSYNNRSNNSYRRSPPRRDSYDNRRGDNYDNRRGGYNDRGNDRGGRNDHSYDKYDKRGEKRGGYDNRRSDYESDRKKYKD